MRFLAAAAAALPLALAHAGADLDAVKTRGVLRCGVSEGLAGFSERNASGRWQGLNADFCRAVAAATLGDPEKVQFVPLKASTRFPSLHSKAIDLLMRNTTWTLTREALLKVQFPATLFYDGQAFMVPKSAGVRSLADLHGATICVEKGTTHEARLPAYFHRLGLSVQPLVIDSVSAVAEAFFAGRCRAYTSDAAQLATVLARAPGGGQGYGILAERISKEPMGPVVRGGDGEWATLVRWVLHVLVAAEEYGVTRSNVVGVMAQRMPGLTGSPGESVARALGVGPDWAVRAISAVGNYGEMYERNLGGASGVVIERGINRLWSQGGLLYAPPLD